MKNQVYTIEKIQKIKKQWLISFVLYSVFSYLPTSISSDDLMINLTDKIGFGFNVNFYSWNHQSFLGAKIALFCLVSWLVYFFAYKTGGIKLLSTIWVGTCCILALQLYSAIYLWMQSGNLFLGFHLEGKELLDAFYIISSYKLYGVNKFLLYTSTKNDCTKDLAC